MRQHFGSLKRLTLSDGIGELTSEEGLARLAELEKAPVAPVPVQAHITSAFDLATKAGCPVYDSIYLAVAVDHRSPLVTEDRRFATAAARAGLSDCVRLLGSF